MIEQLHKRYIEAGRKISTDTRNILPGSIFFALQGETFDGNKYAAEAIKKGACIALIDNADYISPDTILVKNTLETLQDLARYHRQKNGFQVIGITGTNGKTTTKELISGVLSKKYKCHATKGNLNNHIGVPLTILSSTPDSELLVVEMGANHLGEIEQLCKIAEPDYGLITNIGKAHLEGFGSLEGVIKAKSELYNYLINSNKYIFYNEADELLTSKLRNYTKIIPYGSKNSECYAENTHFNNGIKTDLLVKNECIRLNTKLFGNYNVINILAAVKIGLHFEIPIHQIVEAINNYTPQNNRSQIIETSRNTLILDSYNANPVSMRAAIKSFDEIKSDKKLLILGSMKELGATSINEHNDLVDLVLSLQHAKSFLIGKEFSDSEINPDSLFPTTLNLIEHLKENKIEGYQILIKGSRANKLEDIISYL